MNAGKLTKKIFTIALASVLAATGLTACGKNS